MTGNYHGTCTNTALDPPITAVLELTLRRVAASVIEGRLQLSGELTGGSDFVGVLERANQIRFQTVEPGQSLIEWRGRWQDGEFSGDYVARLSAPGLVERGLGTQQGVWRCVKRASARPAPKQRKSATSGAKPNPSRSRTKRQP